MKAIPMNQDEPVINSKKTALPAGFWKHPVHLLALGFGTGYVPKLPGTAGTLIGVVFYFFMQPLNEIFYLAITSVLFLIGIWLCGKTANDLGVHDHSSIVWDEIVGYLVTMIMAPAGWLWMILGFALFRLFDICKPWPVSWADRQTSGGLGIMLDDLIAAIYALLLLQLTVYLL
jgi:phosphatidylglycerophosphatase A